MNKNQIIKVVRKIELPAGSFWLVMGAALVLHGVKHETGDIDVGCTPEAFSLLIESGYTVMHSRSGLRKISIREDIHIYEGFNADTIESIEGIGVADIMSIRRTKLAFGREKDQIDVKLIDKHMEKDKRND